MDLKSVSAVFFSPTGSTRKVVLEISEIIALKAGIPVREIDFTLPKAREKARKFEAGDQVMLSHTRMLEQHYARRAENEVFL